MSTYNEWLAGIKAGDKFAIIPREFSNNTPIILTADKITPTQIVANAGTRNEQRFNRVNGRERGSDSWRAITPVTPEIETLVERRHLENWLGDTARNHRVTLSIDILRAMKKAFDETSK